MEPRSRLTCPRCRESAPLARGAVMEALAGVAVDRDAVGVVVSEAVANAIMHAYRAPGRAPVRVRISVDRRRR